MAQLSERICVRELKDPKKQKSRRDLIVSPQSLSAPAKKGLGASSEEHP